MITIAEPKEHIDKLWGKQKIREGETYRLMRYVLRVDHEDKVLLHNVVTGRLVVLEREEAEALETLPAPYNPAMEQLASEHYLVPEDYDEHQQVVNLRNVLRKLADALSPKGIITHYTILPTTACNARCYYCFERGIQKDTMTKQTADSVIEFIHSHCAGQKVWIRWFGGEPTVAANRITQICEGLHQRGVEFSSRITTNGYLFDEETVETACSVWNLESVMISVDGIGQRYNQVKAFVDASDDPYERVMGNIGLLLARGVGVNLRMNFDKQNYQDFEGLLSDAKRRYPDQRLLQVYVHQINGHYPNVDETRIHGDEKWFSENICTLNDLSREAGFYRRKTELLSLDYRWCIAARDDAITILPNGKLVGCPEQMGADQFKGDLEHGVTNSELVHSWKQFADYERCRQCVLFPACVKIVNCAGKDRCFYKVENLNEAQGLILRLAADPVSDE